MAKNAKKISISQVDKIMKDTFESTVTFEWNGVEVTVEKSLQLSDMLQFCSDVVKTCTNPENGGYMPELKDLAIRMNVVEMYSNVKLPDNLEHKYNILVNSGIVEAILEHINTNQYFEMVESIDSKINAIAASNVGEVHKQLDNVMRVFEQMTSQMEQAMNGIDADVLEKIADSMSDDAAVNKAVLSFVKGNDE